MQTKWVTNISFQTISERNASMKLFSNRHSDFDTKEDTCRIQSMCVCMCDFSGQIKQSQQLFKYDDEFDGQPFRREREQRTKGTIKEESE